MAIQITTYGLALLNANAGNISLDTVKLGSAYNYIPLDTDTDLHGTVVFTTQPTPAAVVNANVVKYSMYVDYNAPGFNFGEVGIYKGSNLVALGTFTDLLTKVAPSGASVGNSLRIDIYLSIVGTNYNMWFDLAESNNSFRIATLQSPDLLPPSKEATPNTYIIQGADSNQGPALAFTDRNGLWSFDAYQYGSQLDATVVSANSMSVVIDISSYSPSMQPEFFGANILEFVTGELYSICRYIKTVVLSGTTATLNFHTPIAKLPIAGDRFKIFRRVGSASLVNGLPIATRDNYGAIKIGAGFSVGVDGRLNVDALTLGAVTSVNNMRGDVILNANNLPNLALVAKTNNYNDLSNKPSAYSLGVMTAAIRGGARLPPSGNLTIVAGDVLELGFAPIKTIGGATPDANGNISIAEAVDGLVGPTELTAGANLNSNITSGLFYARSATVVVNKPVSSAGDATLEVVRDGAATAIMQRWTTDAGTWTRRLTGTTWSSWIKSGGAGSASAIPNNSDLNTYRTPGVFYSKPNGITPPPPLTINSTLSTPSLAIDSDLAGHITTYPSTVVTMTITTEGVDDSNLWTYTHSATAGITFTPSNGGRSVVVTGMIDSLDTGNITFTATYTGRATQTQVLALSKNKLGSGTVVATLSKPSFVLPVDGTGAVLFYDGAATDISVTLDGADDTSNWDVSAQGSAGVTFVQINSGKTIQVDSVPAADVTSTITITITKPGYPPEVKVFTLTKELYVVPQFSSFGVIGDEANLPIVTSAVFTPADTNTPIGIGSVGTLTVMLRNDRDAVAGESPVPYVVAMPSTLVGMDILAGWSLPFVPLAPEETATVTATVEVTAASGWSIVFAPDTVPTASIT